MNVAIYPSKLSNKKMSLKRSVKRLRSHYGSIRRMEVVRDSDGSDTDVVRRKITNLLWFRWNDVVIITNVIRKLCLSYKEFSSRRKNNVYRPQLPNTDKENYTNILQFKSV